MEIRPEDVLKRRPEMPERQGNVIGINAHSEQVSSLDGEIDLLHGQIGKYAITDDRGLINAEPSHICMCPKFQATVYELMDDAEITLQALRNGYPDEYDNYFVAQIDDNLVEKVRNSRNSLNNIYF